MEKQYEFEFVSMMVTYTTGPDEDFSGKAGLREWFKKNKFHEIKSISSCNYKINSRISITR